MKLRNKKTGEIIEKFPDSFIINSGERIRQYDSLSELNAEWEDYEESKNYYCIDWTEPSGIYETRCEDERDEFNKEIGNYFKTKEEAVQAMEKLKAWKRLKDKGFRFNRWTIPEEPETSHIKLIIEAEMDVPDSPYDLDLLFGGEE